MRFVCDVKELASACAAGSKIADGRSTIAILGHVLLTAGSGGVRVRATNLETTFERTVGADVSEEGAATAPAALFAGYLGKLPAGVLDVSGSAESVAVAFGRSTFDVPALDAAIYPPLPSHKRGASFALEGPALREAIEATAFAASDQESRGAILMGVLLDVREGVLTAVATDGYRLARRDAPLSAGPQEGVCARYIVPSRALAEVVRNVGGAGVVEVSVLGSVGNQLAFSGDATTLTVRVVEGEYPDYHQVIPASADRSFVANTAALIGALRRAQTALAEPGGAIALRVEGSRLIVTAESDVSGSAYEELDVEQAGEDVSIAFNAKYLLEILAHVETAQVTMEFSGPIAPAVIRPLGDGIGADRLYVIMPVRR